MSPSWLGSGENKQEFECYGVLLANASPVLDAMLSWGMTERVNRRIEFPDKNPEEWKLFLECIDPSRGALCEDLSYYDIPHENDALAESSVEVLVPWFHELQMDRYLMKCDDILRKGFSIFWEGDASAQQKMSRSIKILSFAMKYP
jgi:hypothetical protein